MCQQTECTCQEPMKDAAHRVSDFCRTFTGDESLAELEEYLSDLRTEVKEVEKLIAQLKK